MNTTTNASAVAMAMFDAGLSVASLAEKAQISLATAYRVAKGNGNVTPETVKAVGKVLGVKPSSLIRLE